MDQIVVADSFTIPDARWHDLLQNSTNNHIFFSPQWQKAWWQVFGSGFELILVSFFDDRELAGIASLKLKDGKLSFVGSPDVCDYMDFISKTGKEDYFSLRLLEYLEKTAWNTFELDSILPQSLALKYFIPLAQQRGYQVETKQTNVSPQLILPSSWDEYFTLLTTKNRHELRRKLRRLEQNQSENYLTVTNEDNWNPAMDRFFKLFQLSSPEKANFMTAQKREFFTAMAGALAQNGNLRLSFLEIAGSPASAALCFDYNNDIYLYNSAYDPVYSGLSVSLLLEAFCIRDAINNRKTRFDFLSGNEPYKYDLGGQDVPIYHCLISRS